MNLTLKNDSKQTVYAAMFGIDENCDWCLFDFTGNTLVKCVTGQTIAMNYITELNGDLTISGMPQLASGIVMFTYNQMPNDFAVVPDANGIPTVQSPSFLPGTSDYQTLFNMVEFTYSGSVYVDITNVDYFATPIELHLKGANNDGHKVDERKGAMTVGRNQVFEDFVSTLSGTAFEGLVVTGSTNKYVRILGPQHGVDYGILPNDYFDDYVNQCWSYYKHHTLTVVTTLDTYKGKVDDNGLLGLTGQSTGAVYNYEKPAPNYAFDIFGCVGILSAPNNEYGAIAARIGAAINRTTLLKYSTQPYCDSNEYYKVKNSANLYAQVLHTFYKDGTTYAFPFDDVCNGSSTLSCQIPSSVTITLEEF